MLEYIRNFSGNIKGADSDIVKTVKHSTEEYLKKKAGNYFFTPGKNHLNYPSTKTIIQAVTSFHQKQTYMIKRLLTFSMCAMLISCAATAQFSGGVRGAVNFSDANSSNFSSLSKFRTGYMVGGYFAARLNQQWSVQTELLYNSIGSRLNNGYHLRLNYISLPVFFKYHFNDIFDVHAGPQINYLTSAYYRTGPINVADIKSNYSNFDLGITVGVGANFGRFNGGVRYYRGFTGYVNTLPGTSGDNKSSLNNSSLSIFAGYRLFGKK